MTHAASLFHGRASRSRDPKADSGPKLYEEKDTYKAAKTARTLSLLYTDNLALAEMRNWLLKSFANAFLHCHSLSEVCAILGEASAVLDEGTGDVSFSRKLLGLSDKLRAENGLKSSGDVEIAAVSVAVHMMTRLLSETGKYRMKSSVDLAGEVAADCASLFCQLSVEYGASARGICIVGSGYHEEIRSGNLQSPRKRGSC